MRFIAPVAVALSLTLAPAAARALEPSALVDGVSWARAEQNRVALEYDIWPSSSSFFGNEFTQVGLAWAVTGQFKVAESVYLDVEIPWAYWTGWSDDFAEGGFAFGNLTAGAHYAAAITDDVAFWAGAKLSVPTQLMDVGGTSLDDMRPLFAASAAMASRAAVDMHRFYPEHISLPFGGGVELRFADFMYYRGTLVPAMHFPVDGDFEFYMDQVNELELRADMGFGGGLRIQEVFMWSESDLIQMAMEPFIGYEPPGAGFIFRLGFMMALDESMGFAFDEGKVASFRTMFGGKF